MRWLRSLFAWQTVRENNSDIYQQNAVTSERRIRFKPLPLGQMRAPWDVGWVEQGLPFGEYYRRLGPPPRPER